MSLNFGTPDKHLMRNDIMHYKDGPAVSASPGVNRPRKEKGIENVDLAIELENMTFLATAHHRILTIKPETWIVDEFCHLASGMLERMRHRQPRPEVIKSRAEEWADQFVAGHLRQRDMSELLNKMDSAYTLLMQLRDFEEDNVHQHDDEKGDTGRWRPDCGREFDKFADVDAEDMIVCAGRRGGARGQRDGGEKKRKEIEDGFHQRFDELSQTVKKVKRGGRGGKTA